MEHVLQTNIIFHVNKFFSDSYSRILALSCREQYS